MSTTGQQLREARTSWTSHSRRPTARSVATAPATTKATYGPSRCSLSAS